MTAHGPIELQQQLPDGLIAPDGRGALTQPPHPGCGSGVRIGVWGKLRAKVAEEAPCILQVLL
jgi:hypothetical protein